MKEVHRERLSGAGALGDAVDAAMLSASSSSGRKTLLVFDFDRTLTNGISMPGETELSKLVRGGQHTVDALQRAKLAGADMYIITARRPVCMTVEQIFASLDHAQSVLSPFFERGEPKRIMRGNVPLARGGHVYAADYQKAVALSHIIALRSQESPEERCSVLFFDDSIVNAHVVANTTMGHLQAAGTEDVVESLSVYWWDCFEEETGENPTMTLSTTTNSDTDYVLHHKHMLWEFGVGYDDCEDRIALYRERGCGRISASEKKAAWLSREAASIKEASQASREKMSGLESALRARFTRGPRALNNLVSALDTIHVDMQEKSKKCVKGGWRAKLAAEKERVAFARSIFGGRSVLSYPRGNVKIGSRMDWETAFQVDIPDTGTTGGVFFISTLAGGSVAVKGGGSAASVAEQWFGTQFLSALGTPVPEIRVVLPEDEEHKDIAKAVKRVAEEHSRRGDSETSTKLMVHALYGAVQSRKYCPLILMECVSGAIPMGNIDTARAKMLLEPRNGDTRACARLEAIGRCWLGDGILGFRDRFCSRLNYSFSQKGANYIDAVNAADSAASRISLTGNCDNVLFSDGGFLAVDGTSSLVSASGFAAIDNHMKLVGKGSRDHLIEQLTSEISSLLDGNGTHCFDWLRFTVYEISGHMLSDEALDVARKGALCALERLPSALAWSDSTLKSIISSESSSIEWKTAIERLDYEGLVNVCHHVQNVVAKSGVSLTAPAPAPFPSSCTGTSTSILDDDITREAKAIAAAPVMWAALSADLRKTLMDERLRGKGTLGTHSAGDLFR